MIEPAAASLRRKIIEIVDALKTTRRPSRNELLSAAEKVLAWKRESGAESLWPRPPLMVTATLDDAWGHGLEVIHLYGEVAGLSMIPLGLLKPPKEVIRACAAHQPDILGLTVLQFDTEEALVEIRNSIPKKTRIVAGGPLFGADPDLARRAGIDFVARNAAAFIEYLLNFQPPWPDAAN
ncbi:cobalamin-dependent protein [Desulfococcus sp.]|uniref:cobalamin-dependent protein n=1 Tax=Desulfococcus sp. TaxID=2025834 RepID=UPI003593496B